MLGNASLGYSFWWLLNDFGFEFFNYLLQLSHDSTLFERLILLLINGRSGMASRYLLSVFFQLPLKVSSLGFRSLELLLKYINSCRLVFRSFRQRVLLLTSNL